MYLQEKFTTNISKFLNYLLWDVFDITLQIYVGNSVLNYLKVLFRHVFFRCYGKDTVRLNNFESFRSNIL